MAQAAVWIACFVLGLAMPQVVRMLLRKKRLPVRVTIDADDPRPRDVARYLAEIAARLDERPERMRIVFDAPSGVELDLEDDGRLVVRVPGRRAYRFDLRHRWIADHPVPLSLAPRQLLLGRLGPLKLLRPLKALKLLRPLILLVDPVDGNRFRVTDRLACHVPIAVYFALSLVAVVGVLLFSPELLLVVTGIALGCALLKHPN
jgi:hypothetical protein